MRSRLRPPLPANLIALAIAAGCCAVVYAQRGAPPRSPAAASASERSTVGTAVIAGRVLAAADGAPLRGAEIRATASSGTSEIRTAVTDAAGRFELGGLRAGTWQVQASKPGFIGVSAGQRHPAQRVSPLTLTTAQRYTVDFALSRGSAISGAVLDEYGDPVAGATVEVFRSAVVGGRRGLTPGVQHDFTDDTGAFRIHSLPAGDYFVGARLRPGSADEPTLSSSGLPTYFPGTPNVSEAQRITLGLGEDRTGVTFGVSPARAVRVSGMLVDSAGSPAKDATVELLSAADLSVAGRPFGNFGLTQPDGRFAILNVAPGEYILSAQVVRTPGGDPELAFMPVTVGTDDPPAISIATSRGASVSGTIVAAPGSRLPPALRASIVATATQRPGTPISAQVDRSTRFSLRGLLGPTLLTIDGLPDGWTLDSIVINGVDITDLPVDFPASGQAPAVVTVSPRAAEAVARVTGPRGSVQNTIVVIFAADRVRWTPPSRFVRRELQRAQQPVRIGGLPPNTDFLAAAFEYLTDPGQLSDPDFLERIRSRAVPFSLAPGESRALDLVVIDP